MPYSFTFFTLDIINKIHKTNEHEKNSHTPVGTGSHDIGKCLPSHF